MPRRKLIRQSKFPYHVVTRTNNRAWFQLPMYKVWNIYKESLVYANEKVPVETNATVLMSNHYHLLVTTPDSNIDNFMMHLNLKLSKLISIHTGIINHKFSNRYKWTIIDNQAYLENVYRYIYQNPLRAGIVKNCFSYPYSSYHFTSFEGTLFNYLPHFDYHASKQSLEKRFSTETENIIRKGLKKSYFRVATRYARPFRFIN